MKAKKLLFSLLSIICFGFAAFTITSCGHEHAWNEVSRTNVTCTEDGVIYYHCPECEENKSIVVAEAKGHTEVKDAAVAPTCTVTGLTEGKHCSVCNEVLVAQEVVPALGHTEVIDAAVAATCTTTGLTEGKHCSVCNETLVAQEVVPALGHTEVIDEAVAATCTATGLTEGKHCSECNEVFVAQKTIGALGHDYTDYICNNCEFNYYTKGLFFVMDNYNNYVVYSYNGTDKEVIIPSVYNNKPVTSIGEGAFQDCWSIKSVKIPDSVTNIGEYAFEYCTSLERVIIGNGVTTIGFRAFQNCWSLKSVIIGNSVTSISAEAFYKCVSITSITIPDCVTGIGSCAFYECDSLYIVYYTGTKEQWDNIAGTGTSYLTEFKIIIYNYVPEE